MRNLYVNGRVLTGTLRMGKYPRPQDQGVRKQGLLGVLCRSIPGTNGAVWLVQHDDGTEAAYWYDELVDLEHGGDVPADNLYRYCGDHLLVHAAYVECGVPASRTILLGRYSDDDQGYQKAQVQAERLGLYHWETGTSRIDPYLLRRLYSTGALLDHCKGRHYRSWSLTAEERFWVDFHLEQLTQYCKYRR